MLGCELILLAPPSSKGALGHRPQHPTANSHVRVLEAGSAFHNTVPPGRNIVLGRMSAQQKYDWVTESHEFELVNMRQLTVQIIILTGH